MTQQLNKTEARQGDRRKANLRVLVFSLAALAVIALIASFFWA